MLLSHTLSLSLFLCRRFLCGKWEGFAAVCRQRELPVSQPTAPNLTQSAKRQNLNPEPSTHSYESMHLAQEIHIRLKPISTPHLPGTPDPQNLLQALNSKLQTSPNPASSPQSTAKTLNSAGAAAYSANLSCRNLARPSLKWTLTKNLLDHFLQGSVI